MMNTHSSSRPLSSRTPPPRQTLQLQLRRVATLGRSALGRSALGRSALGRSALGRSALGRSARGCMALGYLVLGCMMLGGLSLGCKTDVGRAEPLRSAGAPQPAAERGASGERAGSGQLPGGATDDKTGSGREGGSGPNGLAAKGSAAKGSAAKGSGSEGSGANGAAAKSGASKHQPPAVEAQGPVPTEAYPWHHDDSIEALQADSTLRRRFAPPEGYRRVALAKGSFGGWLRELPLAPEGTPVRAYHGGVLLPADHGNIAGVTTLDTGARDLQQCADAVMRMHAEWLWHSDRAAEASYKSGAGPIPWQRFLAGGYTKPKGVSFEWGQRSARANNHATYRKYMDVVFAWSNTVALARQGRKPERAEVRPGDFFVLPGSPGHTVLILDVAERDDGVKVALLGQSFMPAQSFQVLRPSRDRTWFSLADDDGVQTPFWRRFPWSSLRRLDDA